MRPHPRVCVYIYMGVWPKCTAYYIPDILSDELLDSCYPPTIQGMVQCNSCYALVPGIGFCISRISRSPASREYIDISVALSLSSGELSDVG